MLLFPECSETDGIGSPVAPFVPDGLIASYGPHRNAFASAAVKDPDRFEQDMAGTAFEGNPAGMIPDQQVGMSGDDAGSQESEL
jgi:hypothetical protein